MTLDDYFASQFSGGSDELQKRLGAIVIDGRPLGAYETGGERDREGGKRFEEIQWAGIALVGCNADRFIAEIRSLPPRGGGATADFEADLNNGERVILELARVVVGQDVQQGQYYEKIARYAEEGLREVNAAGSTYVYRAYNAINIGEQEARKGGVELTSFIRSEEKLRKRSTTMYPARDSEPLLKRLGVFVSHYQSGGKEARVLWDPLKARIDHEVALAAFQNVLEKKRAKVRHYSRDGRPVWLVLGVPPSPFETFRALSLVQQLAEMELDVAPFARVLVGCYTAGVQFVAGNGKAIYTSLTTTG